MRKIPVYKAEKEAGLVQAIQANASIAYLAPASINKNPNKELALSLAAVKQHTIATNQNQVDLFYLKDILVSTGWNLNDDVFTLAETWSARHTSEDKQFNLNHNIKSVVNGERVFHNDIIGHITEQYCIDAEGKVLDDSLAVDELPEKFHIVNSSVIYRFWPDPDRMEQIGNIIAEIENQTDDKAKWFVSMEVLFNDFDYALVDSKGCQLVVPRTEASAFLTKHLRTYGGKGVFKDYKVGRLLKNIVFSGKGLVENPANPESIILNNTTPFKASANEINSELLNGLGYAINSNLILTETDSMNETELLKKQLTEAQAALAKEQVAKAELENKLTAEANKAVQAKVDELNKSVEAAKASTAELEGKLKAKADELVEVNKKLTEANEKLVKASESLKKIEDEKRVLARKSELVSKLNLSEDVAVGLVETLASLTDEAFAKYVEKAPKAQAAKCEDDEEMKKKKKDEEDKKAWAASEAGKAEAAKKALENAEANKEIGSANASANADVEATRKKIRENYEASRAGKNKKTEPAQK